MKTSTELKLAMDIVAKVNPKLKRHFKRSGTEKIRLKKNKEIVTETDLLINKFVVNKIISKFPSHDIISEEAKAVDHDSECVWYVDPLDGTTNFTYGFTEFATCVGLTKNSRIVAGVIGLPMDNEIYYAETDKGAWLKNKKLHVSTSEHLADSMLLFCTGHSNGEREKFTKFFIGGGLNLKMYRLFSAAGIEMASVASGRADGCVLSGVKPWDVVAGVVLVREAGGRVTNFKGEEWNTTHKTLVASNGLIHDHLIQLTKNVD